jgi:hypothetical protein
VSDQVTNKPAPPPPEPTCPECGAVVRDRLATKCWMCHEPLNVAGTGGAPNPFRLPEPRGDNPGWAVFGGLTLLLFAGLAIDSPGILIGLLILAVPALIRMAVQTERALGAGQTVSFGSMWLAFFTSIGIVAVVGVASAASFFVTCFAVCLVGMGGSAGGTDRFFILAMILSGIVALIVFILLIRALSRRKE